MKFGSGDQWMLMNQHQSALESCYPCHSCWLFGKSETWYMCPFFAVLPSIEHHLQTFFRSFLRCFEVVSHSLIPNYSPDQWEFQDPKLEVRQYHISGHIFWGYSLKFRPYFSALYMVQYFQFRILEWPLTWPLLCPVLLRVFAAKLLQAASSPRPKAPTGPNPRHRLLTYIGSVIKCWKISISSWFLVDLCWFTYWKW